MTTWVKEFPVNYGWVILGAGTLGMIMTSPAQSYVFAVFVESYIQELGISRSIVSMLFAAGTITGSLILPLIGRQIDRRGSRLMVLVIAVCFGLSLIYMGLVSNAIMLLLALTAYRLFGKAGLYLVSTNVINQWWVRRRGMMLGVAGLIMALISISAFPSFTNGLVNFYGWRGTYIIFGCLLLLFMAPLGYGLFRDHPEDFGLAPDGGVTQEEQAGAVEERILEESWKPAEALRTYAFWIFTLGVTMTAIGLTGLFLHMVSIGADNDLSAAAAAAIFVPVGISAAIVNLGSGILIDKIQARFILVAAMLLLSLSLVMARYIPNLLAATLYGITLGTTLGLHRTINTVIWAQYFGRRYLGSISGVATIFVATGTALGPVPLGITRDTLGSYNPALVIMAVIPMALAVASFFAVKPNKDKREMMV